MIVGILETGDVNPTLVPEHGTYPEMFERLLKGADPGLEIRAYRVLDGALPESPTECDAWLVTGSKHGVYDDLPWIEPAKAFLRAARAAGVPMIGVCFGHQLMAEAFGGRAEKSERGWGAGVHAYATRARPPWMGAAPATTHFHAMHQDQVTAIPGDACVLAASAFCPHAMLAYGDPERPEAISIQPHPEFARAYARDLVALRMVETIPRETAEEALASFETPVDNAAFAAWVVAYLRACGVTGEAACADAPMDTPA